MQNLDVISINLWQILISLCNLLILFLILKKFLYNPVKRVMKERQEALDSQYEQAAAAEQTALSHQKEWEERLAAAQTDANRIIETAAQQAEHRGEQIVSEAKLKAEDIVRDAKSQAALEQKKAQAGIKKEIIDVSTLLTEKMLQREIRPEDHRTIIDSVISEIGESND